MDAKTNEYNRQMVVDEWSLGPVRASVQPQTSRHNLRVCQAWEEKPFESEGEDWKY